MKANIKVTNNQNVVEFWTLKAIRESNCSRRMRILSGEGLARSAQREVTVHAKNIDAYQFCCHYASFQLRQMGHKEAIDIFNHDGSQKAIYQA